MKYHTPGKLSCLSLSITLLSVSTYSAFADTTTAQNLPAIPAATNDADYPAWEHSPMHQVTQTVSQMLVERLQNARSDLDANNNESALKSLEAAHHLAAGMSEMMPFATLAEQIKGVETDLRHSKGAILVGDLIPIYKNLEQMDFYAPAVAEFCRNKLKQVESSARQNDQEAALRYLMELDNAIMHTSTYIPVAFVSSQIDNALKMMQTREPDMVAITADIDHALGKLSGK